MDTWVQILLIVTASLVLFWFISNFIVAAVVYSVLLVRTSKKKWRRECSIKDDPEQVKMYEEANLWRDKYLDCMTEVKIENDGFDLYGEYMDFGSDKAVIIIAGRTEGCVYSYYFAEPYRVAGFNVLTIDNRCHGLSSGKYSSLGEKEQRDLLAWGRMLNEKFGNKKIVFHGICIGSATALYALTNDECPSYFAGMVADGMYVDFKESAKNHMIEQKRINIDFCVNLVALYFKWFTGSDMVKQAPINYIDKLEKPILFIYSKQDMYSLPEKGQLLYDKCKAEKQLSWFDYGAHSRVRINNTEKYDKTVIDFVNEKFS